MQYIVLHLNLLHIPFLDMLPSSMLAPADESSMSFVMSSSVSSSSPLWPRRFQWGPGFLTSKLWVSKIQLLTIHWIFWAAWMLYIFMDILSKTWDTPRWPSLFPYPFLPPFLRDSAGVLGGEGERLLFLPAELALRSLRSGVREDWSDKPRVAQGARDGGWEKEPQNERMERLHTQGGEAAGERQQGGGRMPWWWRRQAGFLSSLKITSHTQTFTSGSVRVICLKLSLADKVVK